MDRTKIISAAAGAFLCLPVGCTSTAPEKPPPSEGTQSESTGGSGAIVCAPSDAGCEEAMPCVAPECEEPVVGTGGSITPGGTGGRAPVLMGEPDVTFTPPSGTFVESTQVSIETFRQGAEIRVTTDGTPVTATSPVYSEPLTLTATTEVRGQVFQDGQAVGEEILQHYLARDFDLTVDLPVVVLDSYGAPAPDRDYINAAFFSFETPGSTLADAPTIATRAGFHLRGQSTAMFEKPPYRVELRDSADEDADYAVLGMPKESDWALRGPFADKALIRDAFFYGLGADMGMVAPRFAHCELYRNVGAGPLSEDDYLGVYLMVETIKNSKARLDLSQLDTTEIAPEELTGGYIFKFEWLAAEEPLIACPSGDPCWNDLEVVDPDPLAPEQSSWLQSHLVQFRDALYSPEFTDETLGYTAYIEPDSFVDQIIINELGREMDSYIRSAYFHKDRDGKIVAGPLWDYNLSLDNGGFAENREIEGFQYEQERQPIANDWMGRLLEDPAFQARLSARWQALRSDLLSDSALDARIDALIAPLAAAAARNFERWPNLTTEMIGPFLTPTESTWEGQITVIRTWVKARAAWLDTAWQEPQGQ